jgi:DnaJ-domain-containing protein 1
VAEVEFIKTLAKEFRKLTEKTRAERAKAQEDIARAEEILHKMEADASARKNRTSADAYYVEMLRKIQEELERLNAQRQRARQGAGVGQQVQQWWEVLGVTKDASIEFIKAAYRKVAKASHPDTAPDGKGNTEQFRRATEAYKKGLNENRR